MKKRGQFTVFVILGFVLLVIILMTMFLVSTFTVENIKTQSNKAAVEYLESTAINYYVYTCIDSVVEELVDNMTRQGGVFWDNLLTLDNPITFETIENLEGQHEAREPGKTHIPLKYDLNEDLITSDSEKFNVAYTILDDSMCPVVSQEAPDYPFPDTKLDKLQTKYNSYDLCRFVPKFTQSGVLGYNDLSRLCYASSPNYQTGASATLISPCINNFESENTDKYQSVEMELAQAINRGIGSCVDGFSLYDDEDHQIKVIEEPEAEIVFDDESFSLKVKYEFEIKLKGKEPVLTTKSFDYKSDLRLTRVHNYILNLIRKETKDPFFKIAEDYASVQGYDTNMEVKYLTSQEAFPTCTDCEDDNILLVIDKASVINNQPLHFFAGIKNRKPVLDFIHQSNEGNVFDIVVIEGEEIKIYPKGIDPDDKDVSYDYFGWKQTFDHKFNFAEPTCLSAIINPEDILKLFDNGCLLPVDPLPADTETWKDSSLFTQTFQNANYITTHDDTGPHKTRVITRDESGLEDFQDVDILVVDKPKLVSTVYFAYHNVPENVMSVEDPSDFSSAGSTTTVLGALVGMEVQKLYWKLVEIINAGGNVQRNIIWEKDEVQFPDPAIDKSDITKFPDAPIDIQTIKSVPPQSKTNSPGLEYELILGVNLNFEEGTEQNSYEEPLAVTFYDCIPYRDPATPPYPYNDNSDPFLGDHTCCIGNIPPGPVPPDAPMDFELATDTLECYNAVWYGEKQALIDKGNSLENKDNLQKYYDSNIDPEPTFYKKNVGIGNYNDVYELKFRRLCDGERGNICAGNMGYDVLKVNYNCFDPNIPDEQCQGPLLTLKTTPPIPGECVSYGPGQSFDEAFGKSGATGICNSAFKPSTMGTPGGYGTGTTARCQGSCVGKGCTYAQYDEGRCECKQGEIDGFTYDAECTKEDDVSWEDTICKRSCDFDGACEYESKIDIKCTQLQGDHCLGSDNYCYNSVACSKDVATSTKKDLCERGEKEENTFNYCYWGSLNNACDSSGNCKLNKDWVGSSCPVFGGTCNPDSGWMCNLHI